MQILSETYKKKLMSLAGLNGQTLNESSRVDFLTNDFNERIGRKYDKFLKFYSQGTWSEEKEKDNFIKNIIWKEKLAFLKNDKLVPREKFVDTLSKKVLPTFISADPTDNKQYLSWLINIFLSGNLPTEDFYKIKEALSLFTKNKDKLPIEQRNINSFTDLATLYDAVSQFDGGQELSASEKEKIIKLEGAEQVFEDANWKVIIPKTVEAACLYGKNTKWCTAAESGNNQFNYYNKQGPLYVLIDKRIKDDRNVQKKLQFHFKTNQFMDTTDRQISVTKFFNSNPDLKEFFKKQGEIDAAFEIEHILVSKEDGLKLLKNTDAKLKLIERKGFDFFKDFYIGINATKELITVILSDDEFVHQLFEKGKFSNLMDLYMNLKISDKGLEFLKSRTWLNEWISNSTTKPEQIQNFIIHLIKLGENGKNFARKLLEKGGIIWNALLQPGVGKIGHFFNMLARTDTFGSEGVKMAKNLLSDPNVRTELLSKGISTTSLTMLDKFFLFVRENYQAELYLKNIIW